MDINKTSYEPSEQHQRQDDNSQELTELIDLLSTAPDIPEEPKKQEVPEDEHSQELNDLYASGRDLYEVDMDGKKMWTYTSQNKTYLALEERDGSFLLTAGDSVKVLSVTREGKVSLVCGGKEDHPNVGLAWFSGFDVLGNGNVVVANWCGHGFKGEKRHLIEFDRNNKIVWQWSDADVKSATTVQILK